MKSLFRGLIYILLLERYKLKMRYTAFIVKEGRKIPKGQSIDGFLILYGRLYLVVLNYQHYFFNQAVLQYVATYNVQVLYQPLMIYKLIKYN